MVTRQGVGAFVPRMRAGRSADRFRSVVVAARGARCRWSCAPASKLKQPASPPIARSTAASPRLSSIASMMIDRAPRSGARTRSSEDFALHCSIADATGQPAIPARFWSISGASSSRVRPFRGGPGITQARLQRNVPTGTSRISCMRSAQAPCRRRARRCGGICSTAASAIRGSRCSAKHAGDAGWITRRRS